MMGHDFQQCFGVVFSSSNLSCCPVQKNGLDATALFKACNPKLMALIKACMALVKACMALFKACIAILWHLSFILFFPTSHPSQPPPRKYFHAHFFAITEMEWSWQRLLLCCLATSFGFGPCPVGLCWHFWPPTIRALSSLTLSFAAAASAAPAAGAGLALLCACQIMVVKNGMV